MKHFCLQSRRPRMLSSSHPSVLVPRLGDHPAAAEHLPLAARLPPRQGHVLPCAQCSREGQGRDKTPPCPHGHGRNVGAPAGCATGCMQCSWQCWAGRGVSASLWQRQNCTADTLFPTRFPNWGNWRPHQCQSRCGVSPWCRKQTCLWLAILSACCGSRPAQHLWLQPCVRGYPITTQRQNPARAGTTTPHTHRQSTGLERGLA